MSNFILVLTIIQAFYICYMYSFFKTTKYFHHPIEVLLQRTTFNFWLKHPISNDEYGSKICPFGQLMGFVLAGWILYSFLNPTPTIIILNKIVWIVTFIVALTSNLNAFIYLIPCLIIEIIKNI